MKIAFSWDDGAQEDLRLFDLHERYSLPGIFFVPTRNKEGRDVLSKKMLQNADGDLISFGGHTQNHTYLTSIDFDTIEAEVLDNRNFLEDVLGHRIKHFCLPGGKYTKCMLPILYQHFDTVRTADTMCFLSEKQLCKPTFHFYPRGLKSLVGNAIRNRSYKALPYLARHIKQSYFDQIRGLTLISKEYTDGRIVVWGHSWEIEKMQLWQELEALFQWIKQIECLQCVPYEELFNNKS